MYKFTYLPQETYDYSITPVEKMEVTLTADVTLDEVCRVFTDFLRGVGFPGQTVISWGYDDEEQEPATVPEPEDHYLQPTITRLEVIGRNGRVFGHEKLQGVTVAYQDDGRTMKVFLNEANV